MNDTICESSGKILRKRKSSLVCEYTSRRKDKKLSREYKKNKPRANIKRVIRLPKKVQLERDSNNNRDSKSVKSFKCYDNNNNNNCNWDAHTPTTNCSAHPPTILPQTERQRSCSLATRVRVCVCVPYLLIHPLCVGPHRRRRRRRCRWRGAVNACLYKQMLATDLRLFCSVTPNG